MGSWTYLIEPMARLLDDIGHPTQRLKYVGREAAASPATGSNKRHHAEQQAIVNAALTLPPSSRPAKAKPPSGGTEPAKKATAKKAPAKKTVAKKSTTGKSAAKKPSSRSKR